MGITDINQYKKKPKCWRILCSRYGRITIFDTRLIHISVVPQELWHPGYFSFDHLVLKIEIHVTIKNLLDIRISKGGDIVVVCVTLYSMKLPLFAINENYIPWEEMVIYHWVPLIWFTRFDCFSETMKSNQSNMVAVE